MVGAYFTNLMRWMNGAGAVWVFALTFLICADIAGRELLDSPIMGVPELVSLSLVACVFLQAAYAVHESRLTRAEVLIVRLEQQSPAVGQAWQAQLAGVGVVLFALIAAGMWPDFVRAFRTSEFAGVEGLFKVVVWPIKLIVFLGASVAAIEYFRQRFVASRKAREVVDTDGGRHRWLVLTVPLLIASASLSYVSNTVSSFVIDSRSSMRLVRLSSLRLPPWRLTVV